MKRSSGSRSRQGASATLTRIAWQAFWMVHRWVVSDAERRPQAFCTKAKWQKQSTFELRVGKPWAKVWQGTRSCPADVRHLQSYSASSSAGQSGA